MDEVYLDNSATTRICESSLEIMVAVMKENYGNSSSLHGKGFDAEKILEKSRSIISDFIGCEKSSIYFTSGGTESNNIAIMGTLSKIKNKGYNIVTTLVEHPSVLNAIKYFEKEEFEVRYVSPDSNGEIDEDKLSEAIDEKTKLVSCMLVNNELGAIYPIDGIKKIIRQKRAKALLHVDAVQGFGKIPINVKKLEVDLMSISSHKTHGPKGIGAIYVNNNLKISPIMFGGGQENNLRPGTQPVSLIAAFSEAVTKLAEHKNTYRKIQILNEYCRQQLSGIKEVYINSSRKCLPYILNFSIRGIRSEIMLHYLSSKKIYVSSGSACAKGQQSYVLKCMGISDDLINTSIRVSFCRYNTKHDVDRLILEINNAIMRLIKI